MPDTPSTATPAWPLWRRLCFRFFFLYLLLQMAPWRWLDELPKVGTVTSPLDKVNDWAVTAANTRLFHVRDHLIAPNGSGDTSFAWAEVWLYLSIAAILCVLWSIVDRKRTSYARLDYWFRTIVRYYIASAALTYGIIKLFALQMPFPTTSLMATPLGDLLPMRLSWLFIGYSKPYEVFSGVMELVAGLLLLNRRTVTIGLIAAAGAFLNVVMINLSYDVPVKLFSSHLLLSCLYLLSNDFTRLFRFFMLNQAAPATALYEPPVSSTGMKAARVVVKVLLLYLILAVPFYNSYKRAKMQARPIVSRPFPAGLYDVRRFARNKDTIPALIADSLRWRDVVFDNSGGGSIGTTDALFWQRYRRGYFRFRADTVAHTVSVWKSSFALDSTHLFDMRYDTPDSSTIRFWSSVHGESLYVELTRSSRHFQLGERQFHWLSEYNR